MFILRGNRQGEAMTKESKVANAADIIKMLSALAPDTPVYFDCPSCGRANGFAHIGIAAMVTTEAKNV